MSRASHIVGGEMTYICLGPDGPGRTRYEIRLDIYQDCLTGYDAAIEQDDPAYFAFYDGNNVRVMQDSAVFSRVKVSVPPNFSNQCVLNAPPTCLDRLTFIKEYSLPNNSSGYTVVYQRCCRNGRILNVPGADRIGATYLTRIPPAVSTTPCNNSAVFKNYPPQIICINTPLTYDHSATDADGDSLSYEFCYAYTGGSLTNLKPMPPPPPYQPVVFTGGFTQDRPMAGNPLIQINPETGVIAGTPNIMGIFVVAVCCYEWRNGQIINTVTREFQFQVTNCSKAVTANIPQYSTDFNTYVVLCNGFDVKFRNTSTGGFSYFWNFGLGEGPGNTSTEFEPSFTYPDTGIYKVSLVVNRGSTCPDSIVRLVKVFPYYDADFSIAGLPCPNAPISFSDESRATFNPVTKWRWSFGDGAVSTQQNPQHRYRQGGNYTVRLTSQSIKGCVDSAEKDLFVEQFEPFAGRDTIIVAGESIQFRARGGDSYAWSPGTYLNDSTIRNPLGYYPDTGRISYAVYIRSNGGCEGYDTIRVQVVRQGSLFMPTAFSPNGDGRNDVFRPITVGYRDIAYFRVYNRYGQEVFVSGSLLDAWDGTFNGKPAPSGVYYWVLKATDRFGREQQEKGDVTLLR